MKNTAFLPSRRALSCAAILGTALWGRAHFLVPPAFAKPLKTMTALAPTSVVNLRCEYLHNPLGLDERAPRLSWQTRAAARGWMQKSYRLQVASDAAKLARGEADLWDSGEIQSAQSLNVRYAGKPLASGARCFWRVVVRGEDGAAPVSSALASWQMGLLNQSDWKAQWISAAAPHDAKVEGLTLPPAPFLRREFTLDKPLRHATIYATARGVYELHLNGAKVGDEVLAPGWTDYRRRFQTQAYDVTAQLKRGANALGAVLGDGWFAGYVGFGHQRDHYGAAPALLLQLELEYADGTRQTIGSDTNWRSASGPIIYSDMLMGEMFDARKIEAKWDMPGFAARNWGATVVAAPLKTGTVDVSSQLRAAIKNGALSIVASNDIAGDPIYNTPKKLRVDYTLGGVAHSQTVAENVTLKIPGAGETGGALQIQRAIYGDLNQPTTPSLLVGTRGPEVRVTQEIKPVKITQPSPGVYLFDMGQNMVGVARLRVRGAAGTQIKMRFAEMLNPDGSAYTANLRAARATDTYICKGDGLETWEPRFTFHGFRYVEVTGFPGTPDLSAITGRFIGSDIAQTGTFTSSSALVNQLQSNIDWGQRGNFLSVPTDCPQRDERLGWMGDAQVFVRTATYNRDVASFFEKWMQDVEDAQAPDGGFPDVAPRKVDEANGAPAWADAGVIVPWTIYQSYGDTSIIERHWDSMERYLNYLTEANPNGLWEKRRANDFGDWLSIGADTPKDVLATAYYAYDAALMAKMARVLGRDADAAKYDALFSHIKSAFNAAYVSSDGRIKGDTQTVYLLGLRFDLLPENLRPLAANHLAQNIAAKNNHLSTGFIGVGYLCPTLSDNGHNDLAYKLLLNDTFPSWGFSIRQGATTIWERWDGWTPDKGFQDVGMNSFNHYSLGSVGEWLFGHVGGIATDPNFPGFERILIAPHPGPGLSFANTAYDSVRGRIVSNWKIEGANLTLDVTIPANTRATVSVPTSDASRVMEGGKSAASAQGVKLAKQENGAAIFEIGGGTYQFRAPFASR